MDEKTAVKEKGKLQKFFDNIRGEAKKIVWPSKKDLVKQTLVVIVISLFMGLLIFGMDSLFTLFVNLITNLAGY